MDENPFEFPPELFTQVPLFAEIAKAMSWTAGPVNWDLARQIATAMVKAEQVAPVIDADREELADAARLADAWLRESMSLPESPAILRPLALTPVAWIERALGLYPELLDPLGGKLLGTLGREQDQEGPLGAVMGQLVPLFLGIQCGSVLGALGRSLLTGYDVPLPLEEEGALAVLLPHVDAHAREHSIDRREVRYWAAMHATAHRLLYEALPWTRAHFFSLYHQYLAAIDVNLGETIERLQSLDISNPEQLQASLGEGLFGLASDAIGPAAERLQRFLALLEASAGLAVAAAARGRLLAGPRIAETVARRRAAAGAAEHALERFVGLEIPPETQRRAETFCIGVLAAGGWPLLNAVWEDIERLPTAEEFADSARWIGRVG